MFPLIHLLLHCNYHYCFVYTFIIIMLTASVVCQEFLVTDPEARVRFPALPEKKIVGL
jgi:hypothetical protein